MELKPTTDVLTLAKLQLGFRMALQRCIVLTALCVPGSVVYAQAQAPSDNDQSLAIYRALDDRVGDIKKQALEINRELLVVEEESFIPPAAQLVVFVALNKKSAPSLDNIQIKLEVDDALVANHVYETKEIDAMFRGGMHRLYLGNLPVGSHKLTARVEGRRHDKLVFQTDAEYAVSKAWTRKFASIIVDLADKEDKSKLGFSEL